MDIPPRQADSYVKSPTANHQAVLLFGSNEGLIRERARRIGKTICPDLDDPFQVIRLSGMDLKDDPARLADEYGAMSMMGGRRVVFLTNPNIQVLNTLKSILSGDIAGDALIIIEAPDTNKTAALTKLFISSKTAAALGCYPDDLKSLSSLIEESLGNKGLSATPDVLMALKTLLGEDRGIIRQNLDLLDLYKGEDRSPVTIEEINALFTGGPTQALQFLIDHIFKGNINNIARDLAICKADGYGPSMVIRSLTGQLNLIRLIRAKRRAGMDWTQLFRSLRPPVHFTRQDLYRRISENWSDARLARCQNLLLDAELKCRTRTAIEPVIAERALMAIGRMASGPRR